MNIAFPECFHRGAELSPGRHVCRHPGLFVAPEGVDLSACQHCAAGGFFCNRPVTPEQQAAYDDIDSGIAVGTPHSPFSAEAAKSSKLDSSPSLGQQAWNLASSLAAFVADGLKTVSREEYAARLATCDQCEYRHDDRCLQCGCFIPLKARGRAFTCPLNKWPDPERQRSEIRTAEALISNP